MGGFQGLTVQHALFTAGVRMGYIHFFFLFSLFFLSKPSLFCAGGLDHSLEG